MMAQVDAICFMLRIHSRVQVQDFTPPELLRMSLVDICLQSKMAAPQMPVAEFLSQAITPPEAAAVQTGLAHLKQIQAMTEAEELTQLGRRLATFPLPPQLGKLLLYGTLFGCADAALSLACLLAYECVPAIGHNCVHGLTSIVAWHSHHSCTCMRHAAGARSDRAYISNESVCVHLKSMLTEQFKLQ
jgi:HrpA-like RNA helicase